MPYGVSGICGPVQWLEYDPFDIGTVTIKECYTEGMIRCDGICFFDVVRPFCAAIGQWTIIDCYSTSHLVFTCDEMAPNISFHGTRCYFAGQLTCSGFNCYGNLTYFDSDVAGFDGDNGRTTAQMKRQSTYEGWDFVNVWRIDEGRDYPKLRCFD